jgi:tetratricopeptide (TPR) repeat protein
MFREIKYIVFVCLILCVSGRVSGKVNINGLLSKDRELQTDTIWQWYRQEVQPVDSVYAFSRLRELESIAKKTHNISAEAAALYHRGQYFSRRLQDNRRGENYMLKGIALAGGSGCPIQVARYNHHLGMFYFDTDHQYAKAILYLLRAYDQFADLDFARNQHAGRYLLDLGQVFYHLENYEQCKKYLLMAENYNKGDRRMNEQIENTLGLAYYKSGNDDSAFYYYRKTLAYAEKNGDKVWKGIASGNIGDVYLKQKNYDSARIYFERNYQYCLFGRDNDSTSTIGALNSLAQISLETGDPNKALTQLREAELLLQPFLLRNQYYRQARLYETMSQAYAAKNDLAAAYRYLRIAKEVADSNSRKTNALQYVKIQQQLELGKQTNRINLIQAEKRSEMLKGRFLLAAVIFLVVLFFLISRHRQIKAKKDEEIRQRQQELLESEKIRVEEELRNSSHTLSSYIRNLQEKTALIEQFTVELENLKSAQGRGVSERVDNIQELINTTILTEQGWLEFKHLFDKVHPGFFISLKDRHPDLTESELRLLALTRLNISTKDMAGMLGISAESVRKSRYRLRKKLNLAADDGLEELMEEV